MPRSEEDFGRLTQILAGPQKAGTLKPEKKEDPLDPKTTICEMLASAVEACVLLILAARLMRRGNSRPMVKAASNSALKRKVPDELPPAVKKERGV